VLLYKFSFLDGTLPCRPLLNSCISSFRPIFRVCVGGDLSLAPGGGRFNPVMRARCAPCARSGPLADRIQAILADPALSPRAVGISVTTRMASRSSG